MKLLPKTILYFFLFALSAFFIGGLIFYQSARNVIYRHIDSSLITEKNIIQEEIEHTDSIPDFSASFGRYIVVKMYDSAIVPRQVISNTYIDSLPEGSDIPFRHLSFAGVTPRGKGFSISLYHPMNEMQELLKNITFTLFSIFLALLLAFIIMNFYVYRRLWIPFYDTLHKIAHFDITSNEALNFMHTSTPEFAQLNQTLDQMSRKMRKDYLNLKEFNENASHEIQTPLAIIRSKLDLLMQYENLGREQLDLLQSIHEATTRLSKVNQGLLLISKIENQQFKETEQIMLNPLIEKYLINFDEVIVLKKLKVHTRFEDELKIVLHPMLADILVSNLISNAVKHNLEGGFISCHITPGNLTVSNSGNPLQIDPSLLFARFRKAADHTESVGLGLSIVSRICNENNIKISYTCDESVHRLNITFP